MPRTFPAYWSVRIAAPQDQIPLLEEAFEGESQALSILEGETSGDAILEILYDYEPAAQEIDAALARYATQSQTTAKLAYEIKNLGSLDWIKEVAQDFPPLEIGRWTIHGAAFKDKVHPFTLPLQIDSTSAFGTGEHPTTRGCLMMLDTLLRRFPRLSKARMLDVGCGSGILAMAFAKATGGGALGVDMDAPSIEIAQENLEANALTKQVRLVVGMGYSDADVAAGAPYGLIMANIFADPLCALAKDLASHLDRGGLAILSGILNEQAKAVEAAHKQQGLQVLKRMRLGAWSVLALRKPLSAS